MRKQQLAKQPYCECPHHKGRQLRADHPDYGGAVVDHVIPHRGDEKLFWNGQLQSMTKQCHDGAKQSQERGGAGFWKGCGDDGLPLDESHPWNTTLEHR